MPDQLEAPIPPGQISEHTYERLRSLIENGDLSPGQVLEERALASRLDVSRTPMRAALSRLLGEGMIRRLSNGLLTVREIGLEEYLQLIQFRQLLEGEAAALSAGRIPEADLRALTRDIETALEAEEPDRSLHWDLDDRLHGLIAAHCGNTWLSATILDARRKVRMCNVERLPQRFRETCLEHLDILRALQEGKAKAASDHMRSHIDQVRRGFISLFNNG